MQAAADDFSSGELRSYCSSLGQAARANPDAFFVDDDEIESAAPTTRYVSAEHRTKELTRLLDFF